MPTSRNIEPPPKSAPMFSGGDRLVRRPDGVQGAGQAEVVDVVPGPLGQRPLLAPAGHPRVDQPRVAGQHLVGTEAEPLQDAGPQTLDQHVGVVEQAEQDLAAAAAT